MEKKGNQNKKEQETNKRGRETKGPRERKERRRRRGTYESYGIYKDGYGTEKEEQTEATKKKGKKPFPDWVQVGGVAS
jgi:hypothetical protein